MNNNSKKINSVIKIDKLQKKSKTKKIDTNSVKESSDKNINYFITQSRLNRGQRKYCHCIMKLRSSKTKKKKGINPYPQCKKLAYASSEQFTKDMKLKKGDYNPLQFDITKTNCVMNYDYTNYNLKEIQAFCLEKGLPISYKSKGKTLYYKKNKLVEKLIKNYLNTRK
tara:strand:- start:49 stop:552 length:504 start_codon:yes stop_codon:yes gene_type:complete